MELSSTDTAILLEQPHGAALPTLVEEGGRSVTCFLFRETEERIGELTSDAQVGVHVRAGLLGVADVLLYVNLIRIKDQVFEIWWNWHSPLRPRFENLFDQDEMILAFLSDSPTPVEVVRASWAELGREDLRKARGQIESSEPWSMDAFDSARNAVYESYPTLVALWEALAG